jgi:4,5-DOPA dioxygenase extradiol
MQPFDTYLFMNRYPSLFISHGAPTYALAPGLPGAQLAAFARSLPTPRAVLVLSPHWMTRGVAVCTQAHAEAMHDYGGFPEALYRIRYAPPGAPDVAARAISLLTAAGFAPATQGARALDHGVWVPLRFMFPDATVPIFQISMPHDLTPARAMQLGAALSPLRDEGVLIVGSGSLTHNLYEVEFDNPVATPYVSEFVSWVRNTVVSRDLEALAHTMARAPHAQRAHPSTEHLLPLLFAAGAADASAPNGVLKGGTQHGNLSMESYAFGAEVGVGGAIISPALAAA